MKENSPRWCISKQKERWRPGELFLAKGEHPGVAPLARVEFPMGKYGKRPGDSWGTGLGWVLSLTVAGLMVGGLIVGALVVWALAGVARWPRASGSPVGGTGDAAAPLLTGLGAGQIAAGTYNRT